VFFLWNQATEDSPIGAVFVVCVLLLIVTLVALGGLPLSTFVVIGALLVVGTMVVLGALLIGGALVAIGALLIVGALVVVSALLVGPHKNTPVRRWQQCNLGKPYQHNQHHCMDLSENSKDVWNVMKE
jgi:hypothetical protein